eukprot:1666048-Rhodomonas_salina.2
MSAGGPNSISSLRTGERCDAMVSSFASVFLTQRPTAVCVYALCNSSASGDHGAHGAAEGFRHNC